MSEGFDPLHKWLGIPPSEQPPHCYRLLGLEVFEDNLDVIESAADRQMAFLRGFQSGPQGAIAREVIEQVQVARSWLLQPDRKAQYDAWLREQLSAAAARPQEPAADVLPPSAPAAAEPPSPPPPPVLAQSPFSKPDSSLAPARDDVAELEELFAEIDSYAPTVSTKPRARRHQKIGFGISLGAAILAAVALGFFLVKVNLSWAPEGTVEVDWPEAERQGGALYVDGQPVELPPAGKIVVRVAGGARQVKATRPGYKDYELTIAVTPRKTTAVQPVWRELSDDQKSARLLGLEVTVPGE